MGEKNEISVVSCAVRYDNVDGEDIPVFHNTQVLIKGNVSKMAGTKKVAEHNIEWICDLDGVPVCDTLEAFGASIRIKMAVIRDLDDFSAVAKKLNGSTVKYGDISEWTGKGGQRMPELGRWLLRLMRNGKNIFTREEVQSILDDPTRRAKAQEQFDAMMRSAPEMDI
jgi:hypothetical protein